MRDFTEAQLAFEQILKDDPYRCGKTEGLRGTEIQRHRQSESATATAAESASRALCFPQQARVHGENCELMEELHGR